VMSILERIRDTDRMLQIVDELSRHTGMADATEFQNRVARDEAAAEVAFLEMAEALWNEHRDVLQAFYRHYFHHLSKERQCRVAYTTAVYQHGPLAGIFEQGGKLVAARRPLAPCCLKSRQKLLHRCRLRFVRPGLVGVMMSGGRKRCSKASASSSRQA
jgi:hypothetical protein